MSCTQFMPGGLFRWTEGVLCAGVKHAQTGAERYQEGIGRFTVFENLMA